MKIEKEMVEEALKPFSYKPKTSLGKRLLEIRGKMIGSEEHTLDWEEIEKEVADRRGGLESDTR